jgi:hypothetical protein
MIRILLLKEMMVELVSPTIVVPIGIFDEKIAVGQFYHINVEHEIPYNVMGGMQDNGSWRGPAYTLRMVVS